MSLRATIEMLSIEQPDEKAIAAARLIINEVAQLVVMVRTPEAYLLRRDPQKDSLYALSQTESGLLAASVVTHNYNNGITFVRSLAVDPQARYNGHCRTLMQHIAGQAITHDDPYVKLAPWGEGKEVFPRLGFDYDASCVYMVACSQTILDTHPKIGLQQ